MRLIALAIVAIAIATVKPWAWFGSADGGGGVETVATGPSVFASATSPIGSSTPAPSPSREPGSIECTEPDGWRLVTNTQTSDRVTRSWIVVTPEHAVRPEDLVSGPTIVAAGNIASLGFCADQQSSSTTPAQIMAAWDRAADGSWRPLRLSPSERPAADGGVAVLYRAPDRAAGAGRSTPPGESVLPIPSPTTRPAWPTGSYVFEVSRGAVTVWFAVDLVWPPVYIGGTLPPSSSVAPGASPAGS